MPRRPRTSGDPPGDGPDQEPVARGGNTKRNIVRRIAREMGMPQDVIHEVVQRTFDAILEAIVLDERVEFRNFGVFSVRRMAPRKCRNPSTGRQFHIPVRYTVKFKPGKELEARVRELAKQDEAPFPAPGEAPPEPPPA